MKKSNNKTQNPEDAEPKKRQTIQNKLGKERMSKKLQLQKNSGS